MPCSPCASRKHRNFTIRASPKIYPPTLATSCARRIPACSGASSFITMTFTPGWKAIRLALNRPKSAGTVATKIGLTSTTTTSSPCPTNGNIPGMPLGTSLSTAFLSPSSTPITPRNSSSCFSANGTCIPTASCPPTNGPSATSIPPCTPGPPGASTRSNAASVESRTAASSKKSFTSSF